MTTNLEQLLIALLSTKGRFIDEVNMAPTVNVVDALLRIADGLNNVAGAIRDAQAVVVTVEPAGTTVIEGAGPLDPGGHA